MSRHQKRHGSVAHNVGAVQPGSSPFLQNWCPEEDKQV